MEAIAASAINAANAERRLVMLSLTQIRVAVIAQHRPAGKHQL